MEKLQKICLQRPMGWKVSCMRDGLRTMRRKTVLLREKLGCFKTDHSVLGPPVLTESVDWY